MERLMATASPLCSVNSTTCKSLNIIAVSSLIYAVLETTVSVFVVIFCFYVVVGRFIAQGC
jgi:hypothetical protein